jgi:hypothetical protein
MQLNQVKTKKVLSLLKYGSAKKLTHQSNPLLTYIKESKYYSHLYNIKVSQSPNIRLVEIVSVGTEYTKNLPLGLIVGSLFFFEILSIVPASTASSLTNVPLEVFNYINGLLFSGLQQLDSNSVHVAFTGPTERNALYQQLVGVLSRMPAFHLEVSQSPALA